MTLAIERAKSGRRPFWVVEMDLDYCSLTYGVAPCMATGTTKCYNTRPSCQDPDHFDNGSNPISVKTYRFCSNVLDHPRDLDAMPFVDSVSITPTELAIGAGLGKRGAVTFTLRDGLHNDVGIDKYVNERTYKPLQQGTFFGRLLARNRYFLNRQVRIYKGYLTTGAGGESVFDFANAELRTYFLEKAEGPSNGVVTFTAKDILKMADDARAVAPRPAQGRLLADITAVAATATLTPTGIGNALDANGRPVYGTSGKIRINNEIMSFTRAGDVLTLTARAQNFTTADAHTADEAVQECLVVVGQALHLIAYNLLTTYALVDPSFIDLTAWQTEADLYSQGKVYNTVIASPTGVNKLLSELCEQGPAYFWWDDLGAEIMYRALRPASSAALTLNGDANFIAESVKVQTRRDLRISEAACYFGQKDPTQTLDKLSNYAIAVYDVGTSGLRDKEGTQQTKIIYSRWLDAASRTFVDALLSSILQRYDEPPRQIDFRVSPKDGALETGDLFNANTIRLQGFDGLPEDVTFQALTRGGDEQDSFVFSALEERYSAPTSGAVQLLLSGAFYYAVNLYDLYTTQYAPPSHAIDLVVTIPSGTIVGSNADGVVAFNVDSRWPAGTTITLNLLGRVQGKGGDGGPSGNSPGLAGSFAFYTRWPLTINCTSGSPQLWGGGGGGGGGGGLGAGGGGGGQGSLPGNGASGSGFGDHNGRPGTTESPGEGGAINGGRGGAAGQPGQTSGGGGGAAGGAIDGYSFITFVGTANILGTTVN